MLNNETCRRNSRQLLDDFLVGSVKQDVMSEAKITKVWKSSEVTGLTVATHGQFTDSVHVTQKD